MRSEARSVWMRRGVFCAVALSAGLILGDRLTAAEIEIYRARYEQDGKPVTFVKRYDPATGKITAGLLTAEGGLVPEPEAPRSRAKLSPELESRLKAVPQNEAVAVVIYLDFPPPAHPKLPDFTAFDRKQFLEEETRILAEYQQRKQTLIARLELAPTERGTDLYGTPIVFARALPARIRALAESPAVRGIAERETLRPSPQAPRHPDSRVDGALADTRMRDLQAMGIIGGSTGKLAIWEWGRCIDAVVTTWQADPAGGACALHANEVARVAASFDLWSDVGDATYDLISEEDALDRAIRDLRPFVTINKSEALDYQDPERNKFLNSDDQWIDATLEGRWSAQMTVAAGNDGGPTGYVLHHSFNTINVAMEAGSSWKNPRSPHGDRELPQISARSTPAGGGSSTAAPAVAGTLTVLQEVHGAMIVPPLARAVLFAGAWRQLDPGASWFGDVSSGVDRKKGVGLLDAYESYDILRFAGNQKPGKPAAGKGAWWGVAHDSGTGAPFSRDFDIFLPGTGTTAFRAALAWDNGTTGTRGWGDWDLFDLDILVLDDTGTIVGRSATLDNNYELAEARLPLGKAYKLRVLCRQPPADRGVIFGLAWSSRSTN